MSQKTVVVFDWLVFETLESMCNDYFGELWRHYCAVKWIQNRFDLMDIIKTKVRSSLGEIMQIASDDVGDKMHWYHFWFALYNCYESLDVHCVPLM